MSQRTYSEEEIAEIIKRAAEMESGQLSEKNAPGDLPGLNLDELSEVAAEAGIDPENVRKAAHQLDQPVPDQSTPPSKNEVFAERWVKGKLTEESIDLIISDLNHRHNATHKRKSWRENILEDGEDELEKSTVQRTGQSVEWKYSDDYYEGVEYRVLIQPRKDQFRIRASMKGLWGSNLGDSYYEDDPIEYLSYVPYLAGAVALFSLPYSFLLNLIVAILAFSFLQLTLVPAAKKLSDRFADSGSSKREKRIDRFKREVEQVADELVQLTGGSTVSTENTGRIELPDSKENEQNSKENIQGSKSREKN
ncbi:hypothetical protein DYD21_00300 [Rhodohalobacter sp. SW132]|uniref:hypothetical protein n=1 Tax=Rhodohalobacter sp. SW132 TaxID=2293433 RepID=UPI000E2846E1|nr:hypothetical protein [Rhodohalobacter sp. SW132]REL38431.1 hypothetical protein DYD21_00300 [Rhodohalobacter sp. SW132]